MIQCDVFAEIGINTNLCVATSCFSVIWIFDGLCSFIKQHLPKYSSLPEFQLVVKETSSYYDCRQCGSTGSVINPICLGCAWTCKEAQQHEFASSRPRARRASTPSRVFLKIDLSPWNSAILTGDHTNIDSNQPEALLKQRELKATASVIDFLPIVPSQSPHMPIDQASFNATGVDLHRDHIDDIDTNMINDYNDYAQREVHPVPGNLGDVATATRSVWGKKLLQNKNLIHLSPFVSPQLPLFYSLSQRLSGWNTIPNSATAPWG